MRDGLMSQKPSNNVEKRLLRKVAKVSKDFGLLEDGDKVMVCVSGGKDSYAMLSLLRKLESYAPVDFSIVAVNLDQGQPGFPKEVLPRYLEAEGVDYRIVEQDTYSIVMDKIPEGKTYCSLCSRLRRGIIYDTAVELGATKIALGHHRDDIIETLLLNIFYSGQLKAMPPKLLSDDGRNTVIRPLAYCTERDLMTYARQKAFPIIPCDLCGSQENLKRQKVKALIQSLTEENERVPGNLFASLRNVRPTHLFDKNLREAWRAFKQGEETGDDESLLDLERTPHMGSPIVELADLSLDRSTT
jgi:tRNA 2-thiocytidine biosynthesis protein TtcA